MPRTPAAARSRYASSRRASFDNNYQYLIIIINGVSISAMHNLWRSAMKPPPKDWPRMCSGVYCKNAAQMIDWLCDAFGFEVRLKVEGDGGRIEHSELTYGDGMIMVA